MSNQVLDVDSGAELKAQVFSVCILFSQKEKSPVNNTYICLFIERHGRKLVRNFRSLISSNKFIPAANIITHTPSDNT